jgi:hypothetical protein
MASVAIAADARFPVSSVKVVMLERGTVYVAAGYPDNQTPYQRQLEALWNATPEKQVFVD